MGYWMSIRQLEPSDGAPGQALGNDREALWESARKTQQIEASQVGLVPVGWGVALIACSAVFRVVARGIQGPNTG